MLLCLAPDVARAIGGGREGRSAKPDMSLMVDLDRQGESATSPKNAEGLTRQHSAILIDQAIHWGIW